MSLDPKAARLARELGVLMKAYLPGCEDGHTLLEVSQHFQDGLKNAEAILEDVGCATLHIPVKYGIPPTEAFSLEGDEIKLEIQSNAVNLWFKETPEQTPDCGFAHLSVDHGKLFVDVCDHEGRKVQKRVHVDRD